MYTVNEISKIAGVSVRTLHWYDEIDLLKPRELSSSGYRMYSTKEVDRLQDILFYRAIGIPLKNIKSMLDLKSESRLETLEKHKHNLMAQKEQIETLLLTLDKTIQNEKGEIKMSNNDKFEGFKKKLVEDNEAKYGKEVRERWGDKAADSSNAKMLKMTEEEYNWYQNLAAEILEGLKECVKNGEDPKSAKGQEIAEKHKKWLTGMWGDNHPYSKEAHRGLGEMYVYDERFKKYYDDAIVGAAEFLRDAINEFAKD